VGTLLNTIGVILLIGFGSLGVLAWRIRVADRRRRAQADERTLAEMDPRRRAGETARAEEIVKAWREWS
jgi:hypothetical protein